MHEKLFASAFMPARRTVLRLPLMTYSLGCELQLYGEDSPLLTKSMDEFDTLPFRDQHRAIVRAVCICCVKHPRFFRFWSWRNSGFPIKLTGNWAIFPFSGENIHLAVADFRNYLEAGRLQFKAELPRGDDSPVKFVGAPEILRLYSFVCSHVPREEIAIWGKSAMDFPLGLARMMFQSHCEDRGTLEIYNYKTQVEENHVANSETARLAWINAITDTDRLEALAKHPMIRELPALEKEVAEFDAKGTLCRE